MSYRARIETTFIGRTAKVMLARANGATTTYYGADAAHTLEAGDVDPAIEWWEIPADALPALLSALSGHLGAVEHPQQLRADYEAERKRVDKFIDAIIARQP